MLYLLTFVLLATGWWLWTGHEGRPSLLADVFDTPDTELHRWAGWVLVGLAVAGPILGIRGTITFVRETLRYDRGDGAWFWRWRGERSPDDSAAIAATSTRGNDSSTWHSWARWARQS